MLFSYGLSQVYPAGMCILQECYRNVHDKLIACNTSPDNDYKFSTELVNKG